MRWGNGLLIRLYGFLPEGIGHLLVWILAGMLVLDVTATIFALSGIGRSTQKWEAVDSWFTSISLRIGQWLYGHVDCSRLLHAEAGVAVLYRVSAWRYHRDDLLQDHCGRVDEPEQSGVGTLQHCVGICYCSGDGSSL